MKTEKIDMSLDEIIKTDKTTYKKKGDTGNKKPVGKGGARRTSARNAGPTGRPQRNQGQGQRNQQNTSPQKNRQNLKKSDGGKVKLARSNIWSSLSWMDHVTLFSRTHFEHPICRDQTPDQGFAREKPVPHHHRPRTINQLHKKWRFNG